MSPTSGTGTSSTPTSGPGPETEAGAASPPPPTSGTEMSPTSGPETAAGTASPTSVEEAELALSRTNTPLAWLWRHAYQLADHIAIRHEGESTTYADFAGRVRTAAGVLADLGVRRGDRVMLLTPNRPEFLHVFLAAGYLGALIVPVNFRLVTGEVAYLVENADPAVVVADGRLVGLASTAVERAGLQVPVIGMDPRDDGGLALPDLQPRTVPAPAIVTSADDAAIMYTSGTTGAPKGAVLTYGNFTATALRQANAWGIDDRDVVMIASPLFHIGALCAWLGHLAMGARALVVPSRAFNATEVLDAMEAERVTTTFLVPAQWTALCSEPRVGQRDLHLRYLSWGAAPASEALLRRMLATFPGAGISAAFGQTETAASGVTLAADEALRKIGSVGKPIFSFSVRVVDPDMNDVPRGEVGEIVYRGPSVMSRFWRNEDATAAAFDGGWFHSGDLVRQDEEGFIYVVDRLKDMIICGGENIYCGEVEKAVTAHPKVDEVVLVGRPDPTWGEIPTALIIPVDPDDPPTLEEIRDFCEGRIARYKFPREVVIREDYPRSATGKILKTRLRQEL